VGQFEITVLFLPVGIKIPPIIMRKAVLMALLLASCGSNRNQWVLQSYDEKKGYTFVKDGVSYQAHCFATGHPMLSNNVPDTGSDAMPPDPAFGNETACTDILIYMRKPTPVKQIDGSILVLTEDQNYKLEFEIREAK
jgi:hypothetical protein